MVDLARETSKSTPDHEKLLSLVGTTFNTDWSDFYDRYNSVNKT